MRTVHSQLHCAVKEIYQRKLHLHQTQKARSQDALVSLVLLKSILLKMEHFLCVLKMVSLLTSLLTIIVFFSTQCRTQSSLCRKKKQFSLFITLKAHKSQFYVICVKKKCYLKYFLNLLLPKKRYAKISRFFTEYPYFLRFFIKISRFVTCAGLDPLVLSILNTTVLSHQTHKYSKSFVCILFGFNNILLRRNLLWRAPSTMKWASI